LTQKRLLPYNGCEEPFLFQECKMRIKLNNIYGPPLWFLGNPKDLKISLTYEEPGPIEIDFKHLPRSEQEQIIAAVEARHLDSDMSLPQLRSEWAEANPSVPVQETETPEQQFRAAMAKEVEQRLRKRQEMKAKEDKKVNDKIAYLLKQNVRSLKSALTGQTDERLVQMLLQQERANKKRRVAIQVLEEKLRQLAAKRAKKISRESQLQLKINRWANEKTKVEPVVDSEQETILLTPSDLVEVTEG
jgi:hypothetical protein